MRILGRPRIHAVMKAYAVLRGPLKAWVAEVERAEWSEPADVRTRYPKASVVSKRRIVFRLKGNRFRLVAAVRFASESTTGIVTVKWIGTHADYDRIDVRTIRGSSTEEADHEHSTDPDR